MNSSGHAIKLVRWLFWVSGLTPTVKRLCEAKTLNEQRELWLLKVRKVLMSRILHWIVIGGNFLWKAAGVPPAQRAMIVSDHLDQGGLNPFTVNLNDDNGEAMWEYIENTLGPVAQETLISDDNFYYLLALQGKYSRRWVHDVGTKIGRSLLIIKQMPSTVLISKGSCKAVPPWCV